jgi:P27 family predicted phage terminase small subunit
LAKNFTVIETASTPNPLAPPATLGEAGRRLWADIHGDYIVTDAAGLEMLAQICAEADRVAQCAEVIARDGPTIRMKNGGIRDHPLLRHEVQGRAFICKALRGLGLDIIPARTEIGRPNGSYRGADR